MIMTIIITAKGPNKLKGSNINELNKPAAVLVHNDYLWIADLDNHQIKALRID